jgi:hypothetical protein
MSDRITELKAVIEELKNRWPAHSVPAALLIALEDLEEELAQEVAKQSDNQESDA